MQTVSRKLCGKGLQPKLFHFVDGVKVIKYSEHGSTAAEAGWRIERVTLQDTDVFLGE